jgi:hypothetical protein
LQNALHAPGEDWYSVIVEKSVRALNRSAGTRQFAEKAVPLARRQIAQWQRRTSPHGPATSNLNAPHRQLPDSFQS